MSELMIDLHHNFNNPLTISIPGLTPIYIDLGDNEFHQLRYLNTLAANILMSLRRVYFEYPIPQTANSVYAGGMFVFRKLDKGRYIGEILNKKDVEGRKKILNFAARLAIYKPEVILGKINFAHQGEF